MYYLLYKITNKINGKIYIGVHKTSNIDDCYIGSGKILKRAILKYGIENFEKTILKIFETAEEMFQMESELVNENFIKREDTYNLKCGGEGGWDYINSTNKNLYGCNGKKGFGCENLVCGEELIKILKNKGTYDLFVKKISKTQKKRFQEGFINPFKNKKHTEKTKKIIGEKNSKYQSGKGNSQYGTCWIYNEDLKISKKCKKDEVDSFLLQGWKRGRKIKFTSDKKVISWVKKSK